MVVVQRLDATALYAGAEKTTGLTDWGADLTFREGLDRLVNAIEAMPEADLLRAPFAAEATSLLATRLRLQDDANRHPEVLEEQIVRPMIVTGAPRSGTTWLYELLALDPATRAPRDWEAANPWPAPEIASFDTDPRIAERQAVFDAMVKAVPELATIHPWNTRMPQECNCFTNLHFVSSNFWSSYSVPDYVGWITFGRPEGTFQTHRRVLQQLQWKGPRGRWLLKAPPHLFMLDELIETYPDAMIVQTHREPAAFVPSLASFIWALRRASYGADSPLSDGPTIGREVLLHYEEALERATKSRQRPEVDSRILDVAFRESRTDPIGTVRRIYENFGLELTPEYEETLKRHIAAERPTGADKHRYDPADFGIAKLNIPDRAPSYRARFGDFLTS